MGIDFDALFKRAKKKNQRKEVAVEKPVLIELSLRPLLRPRIIQLPSPHRSKCSLKDGVRSWKGRSGKILRARLDMLIIHSTVGAFAPSVDWLRKHRRTKRSSAHYVIAKDGGIVQLVAEADKAWHAGYGRWNGRGGINSRSLGLELENANDGKDSYPKEQLEATLWLCHRACQRYPITLFNVVGHVDVDPKRKTDPKGFPWEIFRAALYDAVT